MFYLKMNMFKKSFNLVAIIFNILSITIITANTEYYPETLSAANDNDDLSSSTLNGEIEQFNVEYTSPDTINLNTDDNWNNFIDSEDDKFNVDNEIKNKTDTVATTSPIGSAADNFESENDNNLFTSWVEANTPKLFNENKNVSSLGLSPIGMPGRDDKLLLERAKKAITKSTTDRNGTDDNLLKNVDTVLLSEVNKHLDSLKPLDKGVTDDTNSLEDEELSGENQSVSENRIRTDRPKPGQTSLVLVFDGTNSMTDDLILLRSGAEQIIEKFANREDNPIFNYILVPFRDPIIGPTLVTSDQQKLLDTLFEMVLWGGGDCPESALHGIEEALKHALPKSFVYVFTDAIANDFGMDREILTLIQKKQLTITFLLTGFCNSKDSPGYEVFQRLAAASNGQVYNLQKHDVKEILDEIKNSLDKRRVPLGYLDSKKGDSHTIDLDIDENLQEFSVSVAGHKPNITIVDPDKKPFDKGKEVINLENLKVVNVEDPAQGQWNIKAESESAHSVRLTALSDVVFNFGFSINPPSSISSTSFNPIIGSDNILAISPSNSTLIHNLTSVQISLFYDNDQSKPVNFSMDVVKIPNGNGSLSDNDLFITKPFQPPRQQFKININGFDKNGNPLKRLLSTVVQSQEESPPEIDLEMDEIHLNEFSSMSLQCTAKSLIPMSIKWKKAGRVLMEVQKTTTMTLTYDISIAQIKDGGPYTCMASNRQGTVEEQIYVHIKPQTFEVAMSLDKYISFENESNFEIDCNISPPIKDFLLYWKFNDEEIRFNGDYMSEDNKLILPVVKKEQAGKYTCVVQTTTLQKSVGTELIVYFPATIINKSEEEISLRYGETLNIPCKVEGNPPPTISWKFQSPLTMGITNLDIFQDTVFVPDFQPNHEGTYICTADNGYILPNIHKVIVKGIPYGPPKITKLSTNLISVNVGDDIELVCKCDRCRPLLLYSWTANDLEFKNKESIEQNNIKVYRNDFNQQNEMIEYILEIKNVTVDQSGPYKCELGNIFGVDSLLLQIEVLVPPKIERISLDNDTALVSQDENAKIIEGSSAYIKCEVKGKPIPIIEWVKDGSPIIYDKRVYSDLQNTTLTVGETTPSDAGVYECNAINPAGRITKNFTLLVIVPPKLIESDDQFQTTVEGNNVILPCKVYALPPPSITWMFNGKDISVLSTEKYVSENNSLIFQASTSDTGIYECVAINDGGTAKQELVLLIYVEPKILPMEDEIIKVSSNSEAIIKCSAVGFPLPEIAWSYNGNSIENSLDVQILDNGNLQLKNVTINDEGAYTCDAYNNVGLTQKIFYVVVNDPPIITTDIPKQVTILPSERLRIECNAIGNPIPKIYWIASDSSPLDESNILNIESPHPLSDEQVSESEYVCHAENSVGTDRKTVSVIYLRPPQQIQNDDSMDTAKSYSIGDAVELNCPFVNYNQIRWEKNDQILKPTSIIRQEGTGLHIPFVLPEMAGEYSCIVENEAGQAYHSFDLNVLTPPQILLNPNEISNDINEVIDESDPIEITVKAGEDLLIECLAMGNPEPTIEWLKEHNIISNGNSLKIDQALIDYSGLYKCRATNSEGSIEKLYKIDVVSAPTYELNNPEQIIEANTGDTIILNCTMSSNPPAKIKWEKNGNHISEFQEILELRNVTDFDNGIYECIADNIFGEEKVKFYVNIFGKPKINFVSKSLSILNSSDLHLTCTVEGSPIPIITWTVDGRLISSTARIIFDESIIKQLDNNETVMIDGNGNGFNINPFYNVNKFPTNGYTILSHKNGLNNREIISELVFPHMSLKRSGKYTCTATNAIGNDERSADVKILTVPFFMNGTKHTGNVNILEGLPLILNCPAAGQPVPNIYWLKNEKELIESENVKVINSGKNLYILETSSTDSGEIVCLAKNIAGTNQIKFDINILLPPTIITNNRNHQDVNYLYGDDSTDRRTVRQGDNVHLECPVSGNPEPQIIWLQIEYLNNNRLNETVLLVDHSTFDIVAINKSSTFVCYANSTYGHVQMSFHVTVEKPPKLINPHEKYVSTKLYNALILDCAVEGEPPPKVVWFKDDQAIETEYGNVSSALLSNDGQHFRVMSSTKSNAGRYVCVAENHLGSVQRIFHVEIYTPVHWSPWSEWSHCSASCGNGIKMRSRMCLLSNGQPSTSEYLLCVGDALQTDNCYIAPCPINGGWSTWSTWTECPTQCTDSGKNIERQERERFRKCNSPNPEFGGKPCTGNDQQTEICNVHFCPINGQWSAWSAWSTCSVSCGYGIRSRFRKCDSPAPKHGGNFCAGNSTENVKCYQNLCSIDGGWSDWSPWTTCSRTCGRGKRSRTRECNNPTPFGEGKKCDGSGLEVVACVNRQCQIYDMLKNNGAFETISHMQSYTNRNRFENDYSSSDEDYSDESKYEYSESKPTQYVLPLPNEEHTNRVKYDRNKDKDVGNSETVIIRVENVIPISEDTAQISVNMGSRPITVSRAQCNRGFAFDEVLSTCTDINECLQANPCPKNMVCMNTIGNYTCLCPSGFTKIGNKPKCLDINECTQGKHGCSHKCINLLGTYRCECPENMKLDKEKRTCIAIHNDESIRMPRGNSVTDSPLSSFIKYAEMICADGYYLENETCFDIDECYRKEDDCDIEQSCLNINGSYICVPTPCPDTFERDEISGQCIQLCENQPNKNCTENAQIAQTISYTVLSIKTMDFDVPILKLVNYDINGSPLQRTRFIFDDITNTKTFTLEQISNKQGIVYLYAKDNFELAKIYKVKILAKSYDNNGLILYRTIFIIFVYVI